MARLEKLYQQAIEFLNAGKLADAERSFRQFLKNQPKHIGALNLLTVTLMAMERYREAEEFIRSAVRISQNSDVSFYNYGTILKKLGKSQEALEQFNLALRLNSNVSETWNNRGTVHNDLKEYQKALSDFDRAIALDSNHAGAYANKGKSLDELNRPDEALASYDMALAIKPDLTEAWLGRGKVLDVLKRADEALASYDKALVIKPGLMEAWLGRGDTFRALRRFDDAFAEYSKVLAAKPESATAWFRRGEVLLQLKQYDEALVEYDKALAIDPVLSGAWLRRGEVLSELTRHDEAIAAYDKALALEPDFPTAEGARLHAKMCLCDWRNFEAECAHLASSIEKGSVCQPFILVSSLVSPAVQLEGARQFSKKIFPAAEKPIWRGEQYNHNRIRVAYLSADFGEHPVSNLLVGVFEHHDRKRFETFAISFEPHSLGETLTRLKGSFDHFVDVKNRSDIDVALLLREFEIDIAVDLMGYTKSLRTSIFAFRPAPIQINYLGYPGTMGSDYIDYIVGDRFVIPDTQGRFYSEKIIYLPDTFQGNDSKRKIVNPPASRAEAGVPENAFVFCSFGKSYKITPMCFDVWARLLLKIDGSVLWLLSENTNLERNLRKESESRGVDPARLIFAPRTEYSNYLARYRLADLFLDTFPFNAGTTASDALWAGLPLITCSGETFASRMAGSLLNAVGLPEMITESISEYEDLACRLALNPDLLRSIRMKLAANLTSYPLFDTQQFTRHIEEAYTAAYKRNRDALPPANVHVPHSRIDQAR